MKKSLLVFVSLFILPLTPSMPSEAKTLEDLLVEKGVVSRSEVDATSSSPQAKVYWNKGTRFEFPDSGFTSGFSVFVQQKYTFTDKESGEANTSSFTIPKARIKINGTALHKEFDYLLNTEFAGSDGAKLLDASLTWNACEWGNIRMGQYKPSFGRQFNSSEAELQFADRASIADFFAVGRQSGASSSLFNEDKTLVTSAGIFNGLSDEEGANKPGVDTNHAGFLEIRYSPIGKMNSFVEGDLDYTEDLAVNVGAAYGFLDNNNDIGNGLEEVQSNNIIADVNAKVQGFSFHGEYYHGSVDTDSIQSNIEPEGFYTQVGYFLVPKKFEIALRYGLLDCDDGQATDGLCEDADKVNEAGVSLNYFLWKHHLKAQLGYIVINQDGLVEDDADRNTNRWTFQLTSMF